MIVSGNGSSAMLIHGDDKVIVPWTGDSTVLIHGDDKVFALQGGDYALADYRRALPQDYGDPTAVLVGDDKVIVPAPSDSTVLIHGDDKVFAPQGGDSTVLVHGDDKVIAPQPGDYTPAGYRRGASSDYGDPTSIPVGAEPAGPFDWGDAFVGAGVAFAPCWPAAPPRHAAARVPRARRFEASSSETSGPAGARLSPVRAVVSELRAD